MLMQCIGCFQSSLFHNQLTHQTSNLKSLRELCDIFDEVKRVLKDDGTCWVNLGDTYGGLLRINDEQLGDF